MKLANCNEHKNAHDPELSCYMVRHADGKPATPAEIIGEIDRLSEIEAAARNLVDQKGRHHTQQAYERLAALIEVE